MKKKVVLLAAAVAAMGMISACSSGGGKAGEAGVSSAEAGKGDGRIKVTFITTSGGLGDRSFSDSTWAGVQKAEQDFGVEISVVEPKTVADYGTSIVSAVSGGADLILGFSNAWTDPFDEYCSKYPDVYFGGLNSNAEAENLLTAVTSDHEGSFLAGALAAMKTETGTIGVIGAQDSDSINRFIVGYEEGARYINPGIKVLKSYVGSFSDPAKGKEFTLQLKNEGADIIFQVAGGTGEGVFEAVKENDGIYAIGCDANQDYIVEGKILTSMLKQCDVVAYTMIKQVVEGTFEPGRKVYGLKDGGVGLTDFQYTKEFIGEDVIQKLEECKQGIISGDIKVTDVFEK